MTPEARIVIYGGALLFLMLAVALVMFVLLYRKTQKSYLKDRVLLQKEFQSELLSSQLETAQITMNQIAQEIHDNIGQRMTLAIQMNQQGLGGEEMKLLLQEMLSDLRDLSRSLHSPRVKDMGLDLALEKECQLIEKATGKSCIYSPPTEHFALSEQEEIILYRCAQEMLSNVMKHAQTDKILVSLSLQNQSLTLTIEDFGVGFDPSLEFSGLGMKSLKNRVDMMGGELNIQSTLGKGTRVEIVLPQENHP